LREDVQLLIFQLEGKGEIGSILLGCKERHDQLTVKLGERWKAKSPHRIT